MRVLTIPALLIYFAVQGQTVTVFNNVTGFIEIRDQAYFDRLDKTVQSLYVEHMGFYNKALNYYDSGQYDMAYFYFNKSFQFGYFSKLKVRPDDEIVQNKAVYTLKSIMRVKDHTPRQVQNAKELVDDHCDPERKEIAYADYNKWKKNRKYFMIQQKE